MFLVAMEMDAWRIREELWSGGQDNAAKLTNAEFEEALEIIIDEIITGEVPTITLINDMFWFEFDMICDLIGLEFDDETCEILR